MRERPLPLASSSLCVVETPPSFGYKLTDPLCCSSSAHLCIDSFCEENQYGRFKTGSEAESISNTMKPSAEDLLGMQLLVFMFIWILFYFRKLIGF